MTGDSKKYRIVRVGRSMLLDLLCLASMIRGNVLQHCPQFETRNGQGPSGPHVLFRGHSWLRQNSMTRVKS